MSANRSKKIWLIVVSQNLQEETDQYILNYFNGQTIQTYKDLNYEDAYFYFSSQNLIRPILAETSASNPTLSAMAEEFERHINSKTNFRLSIPEIKAQVETVISVFVSAGIMSSEQQQEFFDLAKVTKSPAVANDLGLIRLGDIQMARSMYGGV